MPDFEANAVATFFGMEQWLYRIYGSFGGIYAAEPQKSTSQHVVYWDTNEIRMHWPSEHQLNGTTYDLELQAITTDPYGRSLGCYAHKAAFVMLFQVGAANSFFDWQASADAQTDVAIDLGLLFTRIAGTSTSVTGYTGTESTPSCKPGFCWYVTNEVATISQE